MGKHGGRHVRKRSIWGSVSVVVIFALAGYLLVTNVQVNRTATVNSDTSDLLQERVDTVERLNKDIDSLSTKIDSLKTLTADEGTPNAEEAGSGVKLPALEGPGVRVTLDDSPLWEQKVNGSGITAELNDYVIHRQDIEGVVNALWAGGAESMMIEDQRVLSSTAVRCVGNVLLLHGKLYPPPYKISAIGPTESMITALDNSPSVQTYREYVKSIGLGWKLERVGRLEFPETVSPQALKYAKVE